MWDDDKIHKGIYELSPSFPLDPTMDHIQNELYKTPLYFIIMLASVVHYIEFFVYFFTVGKVFPLIYGMSGKTGRK